MLTRRRFLNIAAAAAALPLIPALRGAVAAPPPVAWRGVAMGAVASMTLVHRDRGAAQRLIARCVAEIDRLESIFSLYRPDSALVRLNGEGVLHHPPLELVELMARAGALARDSGGAFDPTVQPLFELYAQHFAKPDADPAGPPAERLAETLRFVDHRLVEVTSDRIRLGHPGMGVTLNGIAQGYVTDRIATLLRADGLTDMLLDLGELSAAGRHPDGRPWRAGVADPSSPREALFSLDLQELPGGLPALATSGGYRTAFDALRRHHHLLDPRTGDCAAWHSSVTVAAPSATVADGLSTALYVMHASDASELLGHYPLAKAYFVDQNGHLTESG
jgi:FAD:protein FMN transferase